MRMLNVFDPSALETAMLPRPRRATAIDAKRFGSDVPTAENVRPMTESGKPDMSPSVSQHQHMARLSTTSHPTQAAQAAAASLPPLLAYVRTSTIVWCSRNLIGNRTTCAATAPAPACLPGQAMSDGSSSSAWCVVLVGVRRNATTAPSASTKLGARATTASKTSLFGARKKARSASGSARPSPSAYTGARSAAKPWRFGCVTTKPRSAYFAWSSSSRWRYVRTSPSRKTTQRSSHACADARQFM
mmetsp:Transcript_22074/g.66151  ORF Transcript_22074/g.66151 Transcript_22074/m.66151 type:complete len:245 (-) Transcript_22074:210-944(-)